MSHPMVRGYSYAMCRLLGHSWHEVPSDWTPEFGVPMTVRCERCNIERRDTINRNTAEVESRRYVYPEGYLFTHAEDGDILPMRLDFRAAWLEGVLSESKKRRARNRAA